MCSVTFGTHLNVLKDKYSIKPVCLQEKLDRRRSLCYKFCIYCLLSNANYLPPLSNASCHLARNFFFLNRKLSDKLTLCKYKGLVTSHLVHSFIFLIWNLCYVYRLKIFFPNLLLLIPAIFEDIPSHLQLITVKLYNRIYISWGSSIFACFFEGVQKCYSFIIYLLKLSY